MFTKLTKQTKVQKIITYKIVREHTDTTRKYEHIEESI